MTGILWHILPGDPERLRFGVLQTVTPFLVQRSVALFLGAVKSRRATCAGLINGTAPSLASSGVGFSGDRMTGVAQALLLQDFKQAQRFVNTRTVDHGDVKTPHKTAAHDQCVADLVQNQRILAAIA
ncbi:hypothetical protein [Parasedimentitalea marina]|uniref:hypothetical protein n=1 Tax=Parasedimentitalea marina TaxID=2483033 RepID=UPI001EE981A4|nr:hypothetical protein [Parasedimentitalea marina]